MHSGSRITATALGAIIALGLTAEQAADAASGDVWFGVNISSPALCLIIVRNDGTFGLDATRQILSSKETGGVSGTADVYSLRNYDVTVDAVPFFLAMPSGGGTGVTITSSFSGTALNFRGLTFPEQPGNVAVTLNNGFSGTRLNIDMEANRLGSQYPAGNYTALSIVRCE